jgi:hypothetical protein
MPTHFEWRYLVNWMEMPCGANESEKIGCRQTETVTASESTFVDSGNVRRAFRVDV